MSGYMMERECVEAVDRIEARLDRSPISRSHPDSTYFFAAIVGIEVSPLLYIYGDDCIDLLSQYFGEISGLDIVMARKRLRAMIWLSKVIEKVHNGDYNALPYPYSKERRKFYDDLRAFVKKYEQEIYGYSRASA